MENGVACLWALFHSWIYARGDRRLVLGDSRRVLALAPLTASDQTIRNFRFSDKSGHKCKHSKPAWSVAQMQVSKRIIAIADQREETTLGPAGSERRRCEDWALMISRHFRIVQTPRWRLYQPCRSNHIPSSSSSIHHLMAPAGQRPRRSCKLPFTTEIFLKEINVTVILAVLKLFWWV